MFPFNYKRDTHIFHSRLKNIMYIHIYIYIHGAGRKITRLEEIQTFFFFFFFLIILKKFNIISTISWSFNCSREFKNSSA